MFGFLSQSWWATGSPGFVVYASVLAHPSTAEQTLTMTDSEPSPYVNCGSLHELTRGWSGDRPVWIDSGGGLRRVMWADHLERGCGTAGRGWRCCGGCPYLTEAAAAERPYPLFRRPTRRLSPV